MQSALAADPAGTVHVLFPVVNAKEATQATSGVMMYMRLEGGRWSAPVSILASPEATVTQPGLALDPRGYLHLIWSARTIGGADLYYSRAHVSEADHAYGWTKPVQISDVKLANGPFGMASAIAVGKGGAISVVYASLDGQLLYRRSNDGGETWMEQTALVDVRGTELPRPDLPRVAVDSHGRLHVTWTTLAPPVGWPARGVYSSRSFDDGATWTEPIRLFGDNYALVSMAMQEPDIVHYVWNSVGTLRERRYQRSTDGGETWSRTPKRIGTWTGGGFNGFPAMAIDSKGTLHFVTSAELASQGRRLDGIFHLEESDERWTDPEYISPDTMGTRSVEQPAMTISEGNRLHVVYEDDFQRLWYTSYLADAPQLPVQAVPAPPAPVSAPITGATAAAQSAPPAPPAALALAPESLAASSSPQSALLAGIAASLIAVGASVVACLVRIHG
jgi:hypothetical protein